MGEEKWCWNLASWEQLEYDPFWHTNWLFIINIISKLTKHLHLNGNEIMGEFEQDSKNREKTQPSKEKLSYKEFLEEIEQDLKKSGKLSDYPDLHDDSVWNTLPDGDRSGCKEALMVDVYDAKKISD